MSEAESNRVSMRLLDASVKDKLRKLFEELEGKLGIEGLSVTLFTVIMELVGNAVKANLKRAFFSRNQYDLDDPESYAAGMDAFKQNYDRIQKEEYVHALEELELVVTVEVDLDNDRLLTYVENNTLLLHNEERRIRKKLSSAMDAEELAEFYMNYGDDMEGSGLGLAMIVFLIREIGFNPGNFRVYYEDTRTIARLEFPLNTDYIPIRERGLNSAG